jgi:cytochrome P450
VVALEEDPYPIYARLRQEAPVCFIPAVGLWFVTRYQDVEFVGAHRSCFLPS